MKGRIEINNVCSLFAMMEYEASVIPIAKDPVLPTKILPEKLRLARARYTIRGIKRRMFFWGDVIINPIMTIDGQMVSRPFNPPSWFIVLVVIVIIIGIIMM